MKPHLHWADYLVLVIFLVISLSIGVYHSLTGGRQKTTAEFIMADRKLKIIPTAISMFVSFQSGILLLSHSAEIYNYGIQFVIFALVINIIICIFIERIIIPWLYPLQLVSIYEYFEKRYQSKIIRISGAAVGIIFGILITGAVIYAPSAALESATGLPLAVSVPLMTVISVAYTVLGGMRAVIWTDVFQFFIMIGGMVAIMVKGLIVVGGIGNVFRLAEEEGRLVWANLSLDPRERNTVWNILIGAAVHLTSNFGLSQIAAQRYCALSKLKNARTMVLLNIPPLVITISMAGIVGLIVFAYYASIKCDPLVNKEIANANMLLPYFVVTLFADSPGFSGLFLATLFGASLSSVSSMLSSAAANCWEDMFKWRLNHLPETRKVLINRLLIILFGSMATGVAFMAASIESPIIQVIIGVGSSFVGPQVAIFIVGAVSRHANWKGTLLGGIVGTAMTLWLCIGSMTVRKTNQPLPPVSVENCYLRNNGNSTLFHSSLNNTNSTSVDIFYGRNWNQTAETVPGGPSHAIELQGIENFYATSFMWFPAFAFVVTAIVSMIASLIMRDKKLEAMVEERLQIRFRICCDSDEMENQEHPDDENKTSPPQEDKGRMETDVDFLRDMEMKGSKKTEKHSRNDIIENDDVVKDTKNGLATTDN